MKKFIFILLLFTAIKIISNNFDFEICESKEKSNITGFYEAQSICPTSSNKCIKSKCNDFKYFSGSIYSPEIPLLYCKSERNSSTSHYEKLDLLKVCNSPSVFYGCFSKVIYPYEKLLKNKSCRNQHDYKLECSIIYNRVNCKATEEIQKEFNLNKQFNVFEPLTIDHFDFGFSLDPNVYKEYNYFEAIEKIIKEKNDIDFQFIKRLAHHSKYAYNSIYKKEEMVDNWLENLVVLNIKEENILIIAGYDIVLNSIVVAGRGTVYINQSGKPDFSNIINDLKVWREEIEVCIDCKVHSGFYSGYLKIKEPVFNMINSLREIYNVGIIFTGHSYGASLSTLLASEAVNRSDLQPSLITFGSPRVGNKKFANYLNKKIFGKNYRITYKEDPIIKMPLKIDGQFYHVGTEVHFTSSTDFTISKDYNTDTSPSELTIKNLDDHGGYWTFLNS